MPEPALGSPRTVQEMWAADSASRALGMDLTEVTDGRATITMTVREDMLNGHGTAHGGIVAALADSAFAVACNSRGVPTVASGFDVTFTAPARAGQVLTAVAAERVLAGRSGICDVTVTDEAGQVVAEFRGRSRALR
jgi:acyl-CoA thioesterase